MALSWREAFKNSIFHYYHEPTGFFARDLPSLTLGRMPPSSETPDQEPDDSHYYQTHSDKLYQSAEYHCVRRVLLPRQTEQRPRLRERSGSDGLQLNHVCAALWEIKRPSIVAVDVSEGVPACVPQ
jgi:hypothetical protein